MTPTEFDLALGDALRSTEDRPEARLVLEAAASGGMDRFGLMQLVSTWVTAAVDPEALVLPGTGEVGFRLRGLAAGMDRWCRRG